MRRGRLVASCLLIAFLAATLATAAPRTAPKLVVILIADQMRADYVEQYGEHWTGGLRRLVDGGAWFRQAAYPYVATVTCAGHSTIATGSLPPTHGIVGNSWYDRATGKTVYCETDPAAKLIRYGGTGPATEGTSLHNLMVSTLPDELRLQMPHPPRVVTMSMKDYTATMLAGRLADAATWFDGATGLWATSSAFAQAPVPWLERFIAEHRVDAALGETWRKLLPAKAYVHEDDGKGEQGPKQWTSSFPHVLAGASKKPDSNFISAWIGSPFSDVYLAQMAMAAVDELKLGQGEGVDYLAVSFSALDFVGHDFGPRSHEVQDTLARLDQTIGMLLSHLDRRVPNQYVVALTSDHGVAPIPEQVAASGVPAGRIPTTELMAKVDKALEPILGPGKYVARMVGTELYFAQGVLDKLRANPEAIRAVVRSLEETPGVARVFVGEDVASPLFERVDRLSLAVAAGYRRGRSGDLMIILQPYWLFGTGSTGTNHGTPYGYDQRVPVILFGQGIKKGHFDTTEVGPMDIAPTLAHLCGITLPAADGRVLKEALQ